MRASRSGIPTDLPGVLWLSGLQETVREQVGGFRRPGLERMQPAGQEQGVPKQVIIEMVVYELP